VVVKVAIKVIGSLSGQVNFGDQSSRIILPLTRLFGTGLGVESVALDSICAIAFQMESEFKIFIPLVDKVCSLVGFKYLGCEEIGSETFKLFDCKG
jgi:hypothetical protein